MSLLHEWLAGGLLITDGAWGTELQARGLDAGASPDTWNLSHPDRVEAVARAYVEAGSQVILTNTFRANAVAMTADLDAINRAGVAISKRAAAGRALVFASIGPTGKMLMAGEIDRQQARAAFAAQAAALAAAGADALLVETMSDIEEARLAVAAAEEHRAAGNRLLRVRLGQEQGPHDDGRHARGRRRGDGGSGGGRGRRQLRRRRGACRRSICRRLRAACDLPIWIKPNAGLPKMDGDRCPLWHLGGVLRLPLRGAARGRRLVSGRLLRLHARFHPRPGERPMRLKLISCEVLFREMCDACAHSPHQVDLEFLPKGLHDLGGKPMAAKIQEVVDRTPEGVYDAILLGYGLCGNGLDGLAARHTRLVVAARARLHRAADGQPRALPGVLRRATRHVLPLDRLAGARQGPAAVDPPARSGIDESLEALIRKYGEDNGRYLYEELTRYRSHYGKLTFIETGLEAGGKFIAEAAAEAGEKGWSFERLPGDLAWLRRLVDGEWAEAEFVVAEPGQRIAASYDARVVKVQA